jgi:hypothetical protein
MQANVSEKTSYSTDVSDLWWNPSEPGWGMQLVQEANLVFATIFVYAADGKPTWMTAQLTGTGGGQFSGPLYVTGGPYFGGAFNPAAVGVRQAGTMSFTLTAIATGTVNYSVDGVPVTKPVRRQTLATDNYNGTYVVMANLTQTGCLNPAANGSGSLPIGIVISQSSSTMSMVWTFSTGMYCTYSGAYFQDGKMGSFNGSYTCSSGEVGTMAFPEMTNRVGMLSGRVTGRSTNIGCSYTGRFTGINPSVP